MVFHITVNLDEISDSLDTSLKFLNNLSIKSCELRMINNKNIIKLSDEELINLKEKLQKYNITPVSIASPLFKWNVKGENLESNLDLYGMSTSVTLNEQWLYIRKIIFIARFLNIKYIRIFGAIGCSVDDFLCNELFLSMLNETDIIFLIENELGTAVSTADDLIKIGHFIDEKSIKNLKIWFDIANYYRIDPKVGQLIQKLKNYIYYIHCKNYIINDSGIYYVELGKGIINFKTLIHEIREHFINLIFSLEVHEKELDKKAEVVRKSYLTLSEYIDGD